MSHLVTIETRLRNPAAIAAACARLGLPAPVQGTAHLFSGQATGLQVQLPGWKYPVVVNTETGQVRYDDYRGRWGKQAEFNRFLQAYAVEMCRLEARRTGSTVTETVLQDGGIRLQIAEGT
jgi:hypothetical protein